MARLALPLSIAALAALGGCAVPDSNYPDRATPVATASSPGVVATSGQPVLISSGPARAGTVIVPATNAFRTGAGVVESVAAVHITPATTASTGSSAPERLAYRLTIRMDDGTMQAVDQDNRGFRVGDRIEVGGDGRVTRR
jgi:hypothetical protein